MGVDGNTLTLGFPETKAFLKEVAERKRPELETAFGTFFGRPIRVLSVATNLELPPTASDDLLAEAIEYLPTISWTLPKSAEPRARSAGCSAGALAPD